jgi:hypothetical protein
MTARALLVSALFLTACAGPRLKLGQTQGGEVVEAEGAVVNDPADPIGTRKKALLEAQKAAVEKVVGLYLSSKTLVEKAMLVDQNILTRTEGYIKKYDVLSEKRDGDLFKTRIRALVAFGQIGRDLDALGLLKSPAVGNPRVILQLDEKMEGQPTDGHWAADALSQELLNVGFKVVSREALISPDVQKSLQDLAGGSGSASFAQALGAELVILGDVEATPFQSEGLGGFVSYRASLSARVIKGGSREVAMSVTQEASGLGGNAALAGQKARETVGKAAGEELARSLPQALTRQSGVVVSIDGVPDLGSLGGFEKDLRALPGVSDLFLRNYAAGSAQVELETSGISPQDVADRLASNSKVDVQTIMQDSISLKWRH